MSEWTGLHHPERHRIEASGLTSCRKCADAGCSQLCPCECCLAAEVERLTAEVQVLTAECALRPGQTPPRVIAHVRILEAEVERLTAANEVLVVISVKAGKGMAQLTDQVDAVRRVLAESQTDLVAELREQIEAALSGESE